ncbi:type VI secretion protein VasK [Rouxiella silvae]|uniref:Type VI secretion protein VasK n=1 Tax=Rouxiella silvae TaxID=1646373 RepID=A0AA40WYK5_9GAMM|nr:ImcF-related family protein [Rouxiella silvae]MBF6635303.1 type VI secretion protein VasK [Rouxiella silvae]
MKTFSNPWHKSGGVTLLILTVCGIGWLIWNYGERVGLDSIDKKIFAAVILLSIAILTKLWPLIGNSIRQKIASLSAREKGIYPPPEGRIISSAPLCTLLSELRYCLKSNYGFFWRQRVKILLVIGQREHIDILIPQLCSQQWLEGQQTLLIWGGETKNDPDPRVINTLRKLRGRPLDAVVWVNAMSLNELSPPVYVDNLMQMLARCSSALRWRVPLYIWSTQTTPWNQSTRISQPVGCLLPPDCKAEMLRECLHSLLPKLRLRGAQQVLEDTRHDYLLSLAGALSHGGIENFIHSLSTLLTRSRTIPLAGVMFSLPSTLMVNNLAHVWQVDKSWDELLSSVFQLPKALLPQRAGFAWIKTARYCLMVGLSLWGAGMLISFFTNRSLILSSVEQGQLAMSPQSTVVDRMQAQQSLQRTLSKLQYQAKFGAPWFTQFGLNQNTRLLQGLWPYYSRSNTPLMRDEAAAKLEQSLVSLVALSPNSTERNRRTPLAYAQLKAYLMMARPENVDAVFLSQTLHQAWVKREGVDSGVWQAMSPALLSFYAKNLTAHPQWKIAIDDGLVSDVRQILLRQYGLRNAENALYQNMLQQVAKTYSDMTLKQMTGDTDASLLFSTPEVVPGIFTRKAWQEQVSEAINRVVKERREEIDWVLTDSQNSATSALSPEALKARLTERYFNDFASSWLDFLNSIKWNKARSLSDSIDQLQLMADVRQSPLIALMNTLAYQGRTGQTASALSDSLVSSAKNLFNRESQPAISQTVAIHSPLDSTFAPLLTLLDSKTGGDASNTLSLQTFLTRVTRVRLKLQQVTNAADPRAMAQALAQTVFQGKAVDLTDTRDYGSLVAASLGQEWRSFGEALFVLPIDQSWQQLLTPTASSLNAQWKNAIVDEWNNAFGGRYPFKDAAAGASLPLMSQYLRADSGRIQRFLETHLSGVLHKEGSKWVQDSVNAQGLTLNPAFLKAVNMLSHLADQVFTDGDAGLNFELRPGTAKDLMQTDLTIDSQPLSYFNQKPVWKRFRWPNDTHSPGATLSWMSTHSGTRIFADITGPWGLIRLLDKAEVKDYMGGTTLYNLVWRAPDGLPLTYTLRTELGEGPLALRGLRGFVMPESIFLTEHPIQRGPR